MSGEHSTESNSVRLPEQSAAPHRRMPPRAFLMAAATLVLGLFAGFSMASKSVPPATMPPEQSETSTVLETPTPTEIPGNGTFLVGKDVRAGLYHSYRNRLNCAWSRARDASGERGSIIARDVSRGNAYVLLEKGEFFDTSQCATWDRVEGAS